MLLLKLLVHGSMDDTQKTMNTVQLETFVGILILANLFTKSPKLIPPNMQARARIIVRNGVTCSVHIFAKLKFANNIFRTIHQL